MEFENDNNMNNWQSCPVEILIAIFRYLDAKDLLSCMCVSSLWRSIAEHCGQKFGRWLQMANYMKNKGFNFRQRSILDYRKLFINCRLWLSVHQAQVKQKHIYNLKGAQDFHVYRDNLIIIYEDDVKIFNIETGTLSKKMSEKCLDYQETDYLVVKITLQEKRRHISLYSKQHNKTLKSLGLNHYNVLHTKCYISNYKNAVVLFECTPDDCKMTTLGRWYSSPKLLRAYHIYEENLYIYVIRGDVYQNKKGALNIKKVCTLDVPNPQGTLEKPTEMFIGLFHKCSVIYGVESKEDENIIKNIDIEGTERLVLLYYNLTCAVQHDDILLLGFKDGKVGIVIISKLFVNYDLTPVFQFYIHEVVQVQEVEAIKCLEVYEADGCHHVFVGTQNNLYQVVISHPDYIKVMP